MRFVHIKEKEIKEDELLLIGLGDSHLGSIDCDLTKFKKTIDWIKSKTNTRVILMTGYASVELARDALVKGAFDFIAKPFKPKELQAMINKAALSLGHTAYLK